MRAGEITLNSSYSGVFNNERQIGQSYLAFLKLQKYPNNMCFLVYIFYGKQSLDATDRIRI